MSSFNLRLTWAAVVLPLGALLLNLCGYGNISSKIVELSQGLTSGNDTPFRCQNQSYSVEILSIDPLVMYINDFLSEAEIKYITRYSDRRHQAIEKRIKSAHTDDSIDERAPRFPWRDPLNLCLSNRMKSMLGSAQHIETEPVRVIKYTGLDKLQIHYDWFNETRHEGGPPGMPTRPSNRLGSIFAYVQDDCEGGETYFPGVQGVPDDADGDKFSRPESGQGLLVKPRRGNAIFWNNLHANGSGDTRTAHAGMPVTQGTKLGINIWSYYFVDSPMLG